MLSRSPTRIDFRNLNPSCGKLRERPDASCANSELHETHDVVKSVESNSGEDVRDDDRLVQAYSGEENGEANDMYTKDSL